MPEGEGHMQNRSWSALFLVLSVVVGCGGGGNAGGGGGSGFTAVVDGKPWAAEPIGVAARADGLPGGVVVVGTQTADGVTTGLTITLNDITGPGTYALGVGPGVYGGSASVGEGGKGGNANAWVTPLSGLAGSITITAIGDGRLAATFSFDGEADKRNGAGGTRSVTDGRIDLPLGGALVPVADNQGGKLSATLDGKPYNAWGVLAHLVDITGGPGVMIDSHSSENAVSISLSAVDAPGTFSFSNHDPVRAIIVGKNGGDATHCCWGLNTGNDTITVNVTSVSAARVKGTFSGTLQPQPGKPATAPLMITDGVFDVGTAL
jgi:hypothetical protein